MNPKLDKLHSTFTACAVSDRYACIASIKQYLEANPELREYACHPLFVAMTEYHIDILSAERNQLQQFLSERQSIYSDFGLDHTPALFHGAYTFLNKQIRDRIADLDIDIEYYCNDLNKRKQQ